MRMQNSNMRSTAIAALLSLPLAGGAALAQQSQTDQTDQSATPSEDTAAEQSSDSSQHASGSDAAAGDEQADTLVATVGDAEILGSDVMTVIGMLPPQVQSQPPQMLVPMALEQLILRELILEEARGQNLAEDPEVIALVESSANTAEEDAMVQIWLDRELAGVVTDEAVQQVYEGAQAQGAQDLPPLAEVRPQIEQHLRQQAMQDLNARLRQGADIVLYDPTGRPVEQQQNTGAQDQGSGNSGDGSAASGGGDQSSGGATDSAASGDQAEDN